MPKLSRYGARLEGALITYTLPRLAQDAALPDFAGILAGAPTTNRVSQRAGIAQALQTVVRPHLAQDADLEDLPELLEAIERFKGEGDGEDDMGGEPNSAIPMVEPDDDEADDAGGVAEKIKMICEEHHLPPEVCAKLCEAVGEEEHEGGLDFYDRRADDARRRLGRDESEEEREEREHEESAADARRRLGRDESEEEREEREAEDRARDAHRRARDAHRRADDARRGAKAEDARRRAEDMVKRAAEDMRRARDAHHRAAEDRRRKAEDRKRADDKRRADDMISRKDAEDMVKKAVDKRRAEDQAIAEARDFVRPWVGEIRRPGGLAFDSAEQVHREALTALGRTGVDKLHADALRPIIEATPRPGDVQANRVTYAHDAALPAGVKPAAERFPGLGRVSTL